MTQSIVIFEKGQGSYTDCVMRELESEFRSWGYRVSTRVQADITLLNERQWQKTKDAGAIAIVIADADILHDKWATTNANRFFGISPPVKAVVIDRLPMFEYRYIAFQFSPLCYVHSMSRTSSYEGLVSYLVNSLSGKEEA